MKRIPRDPEKFGVIDLFDAIGQKQALKLDDEESTKNFLKSIETSLSDHKTPIFMHGRRVEAMFGYMAASLGRCAVIKKEDSGEVFLDSPDAKVPDYRVVTQAGEQFLVEVKNCHKTDLSSKFSINATYFEGLKSYASLINSEVKIAIYWSRWNQWVLISLNALRRNGAAYVTTFSNSCMQNQMATLGDLTIGTTPPLVFRLLTDPKKPRRIDKNGEVTFTISQVELSCAGQLITEKEEQNLAFYFMLYGDWPTDKPKAQIEEGELLAIECSAKPMEKTPRQGFEVVGSMSGMISRRYNELTVSSGRIERLTPQVEPGSLGISIPNNYQGHVLPLWRFIQEPANTDDRGS